MNQPMQSDDLLIDLLVKQAVEGLTPEEQSAMQAAAAAGGQHTDAELSRFEQAAAAVAMTGLDARPLPDALRRRLLRDAENWAAGRQTQPAPISMAQPAAPAARPAASASSRAAAANSGWWAAAACLVLALFLAGRGPHREATPSAGQLRADLLARSDSLRLSWSPTQDPGGRGASGDLVWNPATQTGVMRFVGLSPNDRRAQQYQLWIFDAERDERYPVDGGVFDVPAGATEVLVPIRAAIAVHQPKLFAVTVEKPGGVVVSQREHIVVTAAPG